MILYDYAIDSQGLIAYINEVNSQNKSQYKCIECDGEMIARTGDLNKWHFAHKKDANCSGEGYLHKLAKRVFLENKSKQIFSHKQFSFSILNDLNGNLAEVFDNWDYEKAVGKYRADILLSSSKHDYKVMIEIKVTHGLTIDKISSGIPIIEINIQNQEDIEHLKSGILNKLRIRYYNILESKQISSSSFNFIEPYNFYIDHINKTKEFNCKYYDGNEGIKYPVYCKHFHVKERVNINCVLCS